MFWLVLFASLRIFIRGRTPFIRLWGRTCLCGRFYEYSKCKKNSRWQVGKLLGVWRVFRSKSMLHYQSNGEWWTLSGLFEISGRLIIKPLDGSLGKGIRIIENTSDKEVLKQRLQTQNILKDSLQKRLSSKTNVWLSCIKNQSIHYESILFVLMEM